MSRIEAIWLTVGSSDLRCGMDRLLGQAVARPDSAQRHHAYLFANRPATRPKVLVFNGAGIWLCARRLQEPAKRGPKAALLAWAPPLARC